MHARTHPQSILRNIYMYSERSFGRYPRSFDETLSYAVEKRVAKVEESPFVKANNLIKRRTGLQVNVTAATTHLYCYFLCTLHSLHPTKEKDWGDMR